MLRKINLIFRSPKHLLSPIPSPFTHQLTFSSSSSPSYFPPNPQNLKINNSNDHLKQALLEMAVQGLETKFQDYNTLLNACVKERNIRGGQRVHTHMIKTHYEPPVYLRTRLIVLYIKCEFLGDARKMFDEMPERNVVSWTAMMSGYSQRGYASEALNLFVQMLRSGILWAY